MSLLASVVRLFACMMATIKASRLNSPCCWLIRVPTISRAANSCDPYQISGQQDIWLSHGENVNTECHDLTGWDVREVRGDS